MEKRSQRNALLDKHSIDLGDVSLRLVSTASAPLPKPCSHYDIIFRWKFEVRELSSYTEGGHKYLIPRPYSATD